MLVPRLKDGQDGRNSHFTPCVAIAWTSRCALLPVIFLVLANTDVIAEDVVLRLQDGSTYVIANPYDFDRRLAIVDHIQQVLKINIKAGISEEEATKIILDREAQKLSNVQREKEAKEADAVRVRNQEKSTDAIDLENIRIQMRGQFHKELPSEVTLEEAKKLLANCLEENRGTYAKEDTKRQEWLKEQERYENEESDLKKRIKNSKAEQRKDEEAERRKRTAFEERLKNADIRKDFERHVLGKSKQAIIGMYGNPSSTQRSSDKTLKTDYYYYDNVCKEWDTSAQFDKNVQVVLEDDICVSVNF